MAEEENTQPDVAEEEEQEPQKKGKGKLIIIIAVISILGLGGAGAYFGGFIGGGDSQTEEGEPGAEGGDDHTAGEGEHGEDGLTGPFFYDLKEFVVNLNVGSQSPSFLKMTVTLELKSELDVPKLEGYLPRIRDSFHIYIRELRKSDLRGSEGVYRLREELLLRVNKISHPMKIRDVLFKEILIQ